MHRPLKVPKLRNAESAHSSTDGRRGSDDDDDDDMFADAHPLDHIESSKARDIGKAAVVHRALSNAVLKTSLASSNALPSVEPLDRSWDDDEHYYRVVAGSVFHDRFVLLKEVGRGAYGQVVLASEFRRKDAAHYSAACHSPDPGDRPDVALKILRANDVIASSGRKEISVLSKLAVADPLDRHFCVRMQEHFDYRGHVCIVFELLSLNLRQILDDYGIKGGKRVGISMDAVRVYARQVFYALSLLERVNIVHGDIKPDNLLVSEDRRRIKLADFGTALYLADTASGISVDHGTRYYRAPEVIMECTPVGYPLDVWAVGCTLFEMYTGFVLFPGSTNNEMLKLMMDARGAFPRKFLTRASASQRQVHFDAEKDVFLYHVLDPVTHQVEMRQLSYSSQPQVHIVDFLKRAMLDARQASVSMSASAASADASKQLGFHVDWVDRTKQNAQEERAVQLLWQLIDRCLAVDPKSRIRPFEALQHSFFTSK
eukprot:ANDGO_00585.mRNA.1 Serine/threonine-protein kinase prp4